MAQSFPGVRILDLGGGLGVPEKPEQHALSIQGPDNSLSSLKQAFGQYEFWLEPGRYIVAKSGIVL